VPPVTIKVLLDAVAFPESVVITLAADVVNATVDPDAAEERGPEPLKVNELPDIDPVLPARVIEVAVPVIVTVEPVAVVEIPPAPTNVIALLDAVAVPELVGTVYTAFVVKLNVEPDPEVERIVPSPVIANTPEEGVAVPVLPVTEVTAPMTVIATH
jgi:hypothetical protein